LQAQKFAMSVTIVQQDTRTLDQLMNNEDYLFVFDDIYKYTPDRIKYLFPGFAITGRFDFIGPLKGFLPAVVVSSPDEIVVTIQPGLAQCESFGLIITKPKAITITQSDIDSYKTANNITTNLFTTYLCVQTNIIGCNDGIKTTNMEWVLSTRSESKRFDLSTAPNCRIPILALDIDTSTTIYNASVNIPLTAELYP
jgi:hypothetical protein